MLPPFGRSFTALCVALLPALLPACQTHRTMDRDGVRGDADSAPSQDDLPELCVRPRSDAVHDVFCTSQRPVVAVLTDLEALME